MAVNRRIEPESPAAESVSGLGARLQRAREAQHLTLEDIAAELRISVPSLRALEQERFDTLGAPVFAKGYLKQYGARLGLEVKELVALYDRSPGTAVVIAPTRSIRLRDDSQITFWIVGGVALVLVAVVLVFWWISQGGTLFG
jgi:cytoskeletal protein RodZ